MSLNISTLASDPHVVERRQDVGVVEVYPNEVDTADQYVFDVANQEWLGQPQQLQ